MPDCKRLFDRVKRDHELTCDYQAPTRRTARRVLGQCTRNGHRIALYRESKGTISYRYTPPSGTDRDAERARTGAHTPEEAFVFADKLLREKAAPVRVSDLPGLSIAPQNAGPTIGEVYDFIRLHFRSRYSGKQWREILKILYCSEQVWSLERPYTTLSGRDIAAYVETRVEVGLTLPSAFSRRPRLGPCKLVTAVNDLQVLAALYRKLQSEVDSVTGEMPFRTNPFDWLLLPAAEKALRTKPSAGRYEVLMRYVDRVDSMGQLRLVLVMARWLGRRLGSISQLKRKDLRLSTAEMLETVRLIERRGHQPRDGVQSEAFAHEFIQGAIFFDRDRDKNTYQRLVPNSRAIRQEIDRYLEQHPDLQPEGPLFPSAENPREPTATVEFIELLHTAEQLAREEGFETEVPILFNSVFHGFRGLRATEMENEQHRPAHVNFIVGWSCKTGSAKEDRYILHDARLIYAAVEGLRPVEIEVEYRQATTAMEEQNAGLRMQIADLIARVDRTKEQEFACEARMANMEAQLGRIENLLAVLAGRSPSLMAGATA